MVPITEHLNNPSNSRLDTSVWNKMVADRHLHL